MNSLLVLAVVLAVTQALVPVPRQAADHTATTRQDTEQQRGTNDGQATPQPFGLNQAKSPENARPAPQKTNEYTPHTVVIRELPAVSVTKDWADWGVWIFSLLLVIVGTAQAYFLWNTLEAIKRQGAQMEEQTKVQRGAMKQLVDLGEWRTEDVWDEDPHLRVSFSVINPSGFLLVVQYMEIWFFPGLTDTYLPFRSGTPILPGKSVRVDLDIPLDIERLGTFRTSLLGLEIGGEIQFINTFNEDVTQEISGVLSCNIAENSWEPTISLRPTQPGQKPKG